MTASEIRFGPFSLERESARLMRGEDVVKLRPKSLDVLRYLAQRPGQKLETALPIAGTAYLIDEVAMTYAVPGIPHGIIHN